MIRHDLINSQFWFFNSVSDRLKSSRVSKESLCLSLYIVICRFIYLWNHLFFDRVPWDRSWWIHHAAQQSGSKQIWRSRDWKSSTNRYRPAKSVVLSLLRFNFCFGCYCFFRFRCHTMHYWFVYFVSNLVRTRISPLPWNWLYGLVRRLSFRKWMAWNLSCTQSYAETSSAKVRLSYAFLLQLK